MLAPIRGWFVVFLGPGVDVIHASTHEQAPPTSFRVVWYGVNREERVWGWVGRSG